MDNLKTSLIIQIFITFFSYSSSLPVFNKTRIIPDRLIEGDIAIFRSKNSNVPSGSHDKWDNGVVPYVIDFDFEPESRTLIREALSLIEKQTGFCVKFTEHQGEESWLRFIGEEGCWSEIGKNKEGGEQWLSLGYGCMSLNVIVHEVVHALGFWHEHSRPDRDSHVTINWSNIRDEYREQFFKQDYDVIDTMGTPYDYCSIMHYAYNAFAIDPSRGTIIPKRLEVEMEKMGKRNDLSEIDIQKIKKYYKCQ